MPRGGAPAIAPTIAPTPAPVQNRACYNCGDPNHMRNQCPRLLANAPPARGRAFNINANQAQAANDVVNGTFLLNDQYAHILFDSGADRSFVSLEFEPLLAKTRTKLGTPNNCRSC